MTIGDRIRNKRMELHISQKELADKVGVSKQSMYKYENNIVTGIPSDTIESIAKALETTPQYLMGWTTDPYDYDTDDEGRFSDDSIPQEAQQRLLKMFNGDKSKAWVAYWNYGVNEFAKESKDFLPLKNDTDDLVKFALFGKTDINNSAKQKNTAKKDDGSNVTFIKDEQLIRFPVIGSISAGYTGLALEEYTGEYQVIPSSYLHGPPENYFILHVKGNSMYPRLLSGDCVLVKRAPTIPNGKVGVVLYNGDEATVKKINYDEGKSIDLIPFNPEYQTKHIEGEDLNQCKILGEVVKLIRDM